MPFTRSPRVRPVLRVLTMGAFALGLAHLPWTAHAAGDGDDWSLSRSDKDPTLVAQRFSKLRRRPFDTKQWSALLKALGAKGLQKKIASALKANPRDVSLQILDARATMALGRPAEAANKLEGIGATTKKFEASVFELRLDALEAAGDHRTAYRILFERASKATPKSKAQIALFRRAYEVAERGNRDQEALSMAKRLATLQPDSSTAQLRWARAATRMGQHSVADRVYADAIDQAGRNRDELVAERARARMAADNPAGAAKLLWDMLEDPKRGSRSNRTRWWEDLAQAHRRARSTDRLIPKLTAWLESNDGEATPWRVLAEAQESMGVDPEPAMRRALALSPRDTEMHVGLIESLEQRGENEKAVEEYRKLLAKNPREIQSGLELASRLVGAGERELGMDLAKDIEGKVGRRAHGLMLLLDFYNLNDEQEMALDVAVRLVKAHPRKEEARIALGEQLYQMNRVLEALNQWSKLPKLIRPAHKGWARHAQVLSEHGRTAEAVISLKKAIKLAPGEPNYLRLRAVLAEEQRRPNQALGLWEEVRRSASEPSEKLLRDEARTRVVELLVGGSIPKRRFKLDRAARESQDVLDKGEPLDDAIEAGKFLAELHTRRENYSAAVSVQHRMLELSPNDPQRLEELANAQRRAGQVKSAMGTLEELLDAEPGRQADVLAEMSELAFEAGDEDRALKVATRAAKTDRTQVEALVRLGELHERRGNTEAAADAYERALATQPADARARLRLAELELTRGNAERSAELLREVLDHGGQPELLREAGRRALDLAEVSGSLDALLALAIKRTTRRPEADEPRQFLLEALDRVDPKDVERWLDDASQGGDRSDRERALRRPLVASLSRGSVGARLRAAEHLGRLRLPQTAVPLAKMGSGLAAPRDATQTVREAFERARLTAIRAAGELRDPNAVDIFVALLGDARTSGGARQAAAWALARGGSERGAVALAPYLQTGVDHQLSAWACVALAAHPRSEVASEHGLAAAELARDSNHATVRHACAYAESALTPDARVERLHRQLRSSDPTLAAVAAWRLGQSATVDARSVEALFGRYIGPGGLARDASAAALAHLLGKDGKTEGHPKSNERGSSAPTAPSGDAWATVIDRWLHRKIAPDFEPLSTEELTPVDAAVREALRSAESGTRAERRAAERMRRECRVRGSGDQICLSPLSDEPYPL